MTFAVADYRALLTIRKGKILNKLICSTNEVQLNDFFFILAGGVNGLIKSLAVYIKAIRLHLCHRFYNRWLDRGIYETEMKFWAVFGKQGCREKKLPTAISMQLFGVVFSTFWGQKKYFKKNF